MKGPVPGTPEFAVSFVGASGLDSKWVLPSRHLLWLRKGSFGYLMKPRESDQAGPRRSRAEVK